MSCTLAMECHSHPDMLCRAAEQPLLEHLLLINQKSSSLLSWYNLIKYQSLIRDCDIRVDMLPGVLGNDFINTFNGLMKSVSDLNCKIRTFSAENVLDFN